MRKAKPLASVSLDLDDLWTYLKTRGDSAWEALPSYLPGFVPLALQVLERAALRITVFVVGTDALRLANRPYLRAIVEQGHRVGNHTLSHHCWLHLLTPEELEAEVVRAEDAIGEATGQRPIGFRGPGFSWSPELLELLSTREYLYDASTLPSFLGPVARRYFLARSGMSSEERNRRRGLYGGFRDGFRPLYPYHWQLRSGKQILEIPITTFPVIKVPFHMSYLLYLGGISHTLMFTYLGAAIRTCLVSGVRPSFLLHPLDFLGIEQAPGLSFFPGMAMSGERKRHLVLRTLQVLGESFDLVPMEQHAGDVFAAGTPPARVPAFA
jgi:peptidoglycan/xylan/chitin deacetylase (PgdA/CDA1 family)